MFKKHVAVVAAEHMVELDLTSFCIFDAFGAFPPVASLSAARPSATCDLKN